MEEFRKTAKKELSIVIFLVKIWTMNFQNMKQEWKPLQNNALSCVTGESWRSKYWNPRDGIFFYYYYYL